MKGWTKISSDASGKRVAARCDRCDRVTTLSAEALDAGVTCPCSPLSADRRTALHDEAVERRSRRDRDWRPGR